MNAVLDYLALSTERSLRTGYYNVLLLTVSFQ